MIFSIYYHPKNSLLYHNTIFRIQIQCYHNRSSHISILNHLGTYLYIQYYYFSTLSLSQNCLQYHNTIFRIPIQYYPNTISHISIQYHPGTILYISIQFSGYTLNWQQKKFSCRQPIGWGGVPISIIHILLQY